MAGRARRWSCRHRRLRRQGPSPGTIGDQQQVTGYLGDLLLVNTFIDHDSSQGTITSPAFTIAKSHLNLLAGGDNHP